MKFLKRVLCYITILSLSISTLSGCSRDSINISPAQTMRQGEVFSRTGYKIKSTLTPQNSIAQGDIVFEVYVDSKGNGQGLVSYNDNVYNVIISGNLLYIEISDSVYSRVTDFDGHLTPDVMNVSVVQDLESVGFTLIDGSVAALQATSTDFIVDNQYSKVDLIYDNVAISQNDGMRLAQICAVLDRDAVNTSITENEEEGEKVEKSSFYNDSWIGVEIHNKIYSIGDYCNPNTYFENSTPEGINPSYAYNADKKVELLHVSYVSSDGSTTFVTTDGYVQNISTSSDFKFLGLYKGMPEDDLRYKLGLNLKKDEQDKWVPIAEGLEADRDGKTYIVKYDNLTAQLTVGSKTKQLESITLQNHIDFLEGVE